MSRFSANCPNCGAKIEFLWSGAVQTTCGFCKSILVRQDKDLTKVGEMADLPADVSTIQIGTDGQYKKKSFLVVGRLVYQWEQGGWNEWHIVFNDGSSGWLSDAQAQYAITFLAQPTAPLPASSGANRGVQLSLGGVNYEITSLTKAHYTGTQGELPFEYWDKTDLLFADLSTSDARFGTIDYSEDPPLLFTGEYVEFNDLKLKNLRQEQDGGAKATSKGFNCPKCGAALELRSGAAAVNVVCIQCLSVLDATDPNLKILQTFKAKERVHPFIPMGSKGTLKGEQYEVIGFQQRSTESDGETYSWREYVLFSPTQGFRYLSEYDGHWNLIAAVKGLPASGKDKKPAPINFAGKSFRHFSTSVATTTFVMGEFPWQVRVGDSAVCMDFVAPPLMLSSETTDNERTWSLGEYTSGQDLWQAFQLKDKPPTPIGVYANQPAPPAPPASKHWTMFMLFFAILMTMIVATAIFSRNEQVFTNQFSLPSASFVTPTFELKGRPSNVVIQVKTDFDNNWAYFSFALINDQTGQAWDVGHEVSYYHGYEDGESWSEGDREARITLPTVPSGTYYLRVEPETDDKPVPARYVLTVKRDVPHYVWYLVALLLLFAWPVLRSFRGGGGSNFERQRWANSDYGD
jgi:hypothetical protein